MQFCSACKQHTKPDFKVEFTSPQEKNKQEPQELEKNI